MNNLFGPIDMDALMDSFVIMGKGMLGILSVLIVIALFVLLLTKLTSGKVNKDEDKKDS